MKSESWFLKTELDAFGERIKNIAQPHKMKELSENIERTGKDLLKFINKYESIKFNKDLYLDFWKKVKSYYQYHLVVKYLGDYLSQEVLDEYFEIISSLRVNYAEPIGKSVFVIIDKIISDVSASCGLDNSLVSNMTRDEIMKYYETSNIPDIHSLENRHKNSVVIGWENGYNFVTGDKATKLESYLYQESVHSETEITGVAAFLGKAKGTARVIRDPNNYDVFNEGDILVTGMTHVDYIPLVKLAAGLVTDSGGILSHAAIIARELKKPCIIATKNGTHIIKSGDTVLVDADNSVVRITKENKYGKIT